MFEKPLSTGASLRTKKGLQGWQNKARQGYENHGRGRPPRSAVAVHVESANPHEVKLALPTLVRSVVPEAPQNLVGDNVEGLALELLAGAARQGARVSENGTARTARVASRIPSCIAS
jgi:hypothetical protein